MTNTGKFALTQTDEEDDKCPAYLYLPSHPGERIHGVVKRSVMLRDLIKEYSDQNPEVVLDFDNDGKLIGIEFF